MFDQMNSRAIDDIHRYRINKYLSSSYFRQNRSAMHGHPCPLNFRAAAGDKPYEDWCDTESKPPFRRYHLLRRNHAR
jgi:hypothetical protein